MASYDAPTIVLPLEGGGYRRGYSASFWQDLLSKLIGEEK